MFFGSDIMVKLFIVPIDIIGAALFYLVYLKDRDRQLNKQFGLMILFTVMWTNFALLSRIISNLEFSLISLRVSWIATPLLFATLYFFSISLTQYDKTRKFMVLSLAIGSSLMIMVPNLIISRVDFNARGDLDIFYGKAIIPFLIALTVIMIVTLIPLFKTTLSSPEEREKIKLFFMGLSFFYVMNLIFNMTLPIFLGISRYYYFGDYSTIILLIAIAAAIAKHQLINIKIITAEILVLAGLALLFINIFI